MKLMHDGLVLASLQERFVLKGNGSVGVGEKSESGFLIFRFGMLLESLGEILELRRIVCLELINISLQVNYNFNVK